MKKILLALTLIAGPAWAEPPQIVSAVALAQGGAWRFEVTLRHPDTGWDHYADGWRIEDSTGTVLGTRVLHHPHVTEQPFTRALGGVALPEGIQEVFVRAKCSVDGWSEETQKLVLQAP